MNATKLRFAAIATVLGLAAVLAVFYTRAPALTHTTEDFQIVLVADGLVKPWSLAFLPEGGFLLTERGGRLWRFDPDGARHEVRGVPPVFSKGQGGLFDILVPRDFPARREVLLSFARPQGADGAAGTALARARLADDGLEELAVLWEMPPGTSGGRHFGGRIAEAPDGSLFLSLGERGLFDPAQDLGALAGKIIHLTRDGAPVPDGPFATAAHPEIYSLGHRNPQGLAFDASGQLWASEHGAMGGDEVNRIEPGRNYGWPVIAYGRNYDGTKIGEGSAKPGMEQPAHYWDPSIAPSGHTIYSGRLWPDWAGRHFLGSLKFDYISILDPADGWSETAITAPETGRVRDVREAPDGTIWFLSEKQGAVFQIQPALKALD